MSAVSGSSGGQGPYDCGGNNNSSRSPDLSPQEEEVVKKVSKQAEKALESVLGGCSVCSCPSGSCIVNKPIKFKPTDEKAWEKVLATATRKLQELSRGGNNGNPNSYDWHPDDPSSNSRNHDEDKIGDPNAYNG